MAYKAVSLPAQMGEEEWLEKTGLPPSIASKIAHAIVTRSNMFVKPGETHRENDSYVMELFDETKTRNLTAEISSWTLPAYNLCLMQLAVICDDALSFHYLVQHYKSPEGKWPEGMDPDRDKEPCENHPLHLAYAYGQCSVVHHLESVYHELTFKKGSVRVALNPSLTPEAPVVSLDAPLYGSCVDLALHNKHMSLVLYLIPEYFTVLQRTSIVPAIECLWLALDHVLENGQMDELCLTFLLKHDDWGSEVNDNLFLMCCQMLNAHEREESSKTCLTNSGILMAMLKEAVRNERPDLLTLAARYCTQAQLQEVISFLEEKPDSAKLPTSCCEHYFSGYPSVTPQVGADVLKAFQDEQKGRTLKHEAVLAILRSVEGDARQVEISLDLPKPFLDLLRVPFQDLYDRLTGSTQ